MEKPPYVIHDGNMTTVEVEQIPNVMFDDLSPRPFLLIVVVGISLHLLLVR